MRVLSLRWSSWWPFGTRHTPAPRPEPTPYQTALWNWRHARTAPTLLAYWALESDAGRRRDAVQLFMCRGLFGELGETGSNGDIVRRAFRLVEPQIRMVMAEDPEALDINFVNNIELWRELHKHLETYLPLGADQEFELVIERMSAIETIFGEAISISAIEIGFRFMLKLLGSLPNEDLIWLTENDRHMKLWLSALEVAKQFARRRTGMPLSALDVALEMKDAPPRLVLQVQRELQARD